MPLPLLSDAFAVYACDSFGDNTDENLIQERLDPTKDLIKGDGSTASTFPTFTQYTDHHIAYYVFDGSNDYVSNWPVATGAGYFVSAALSDSYPDGQPYVIQVTDDSLETLLTTAGSFSGNLHSLIFFETEPTTAEKKELADYQLRQMWREQWVDPYTARLIRAGDCVLYCDFEHPEELYNDYSGVSTITPTGCDWDYGLVLSGGGSYITIPDDPDLRLDELTAFFSMASIPTGTYLEKSGNYFVGMISLNRIIFNASSAYPGPSTSDRLFSMAVTAESDTSLSFYWDGELHNTNTPVTVDDSGTSDINFGDDPSGTFYRLALFNRVLTADEIKLLHYSALLGHDEAGGLVRARIIDVDGDDEITTSQTNVVINCQLAGETEGKVYITEAPLFSLVGAFEQSIDSWTDTSIQFDVTGLV